jgi:PhnB protein
VFVNPYLNFNGNCEEAFRYYAKVLGGTIEAMMAHEGTEAEQHVPPEWRKKIIHARMKVGNALLMGSDAPPGRYSEPKGMSVSLQVGTPADADRVFQALADNGTVQMPITKTFFSERFGVVVDRFGIPWMVNCDPALA